MQTELLFPENAKVNAEQTMVGVEITTKKRAISGAEYEVQVRYSARSAVRNMRSRSDIPIPTKG